jgi:hypothetical protein
MSLQPSGLTALTLRLCSSRYFDFECYPFDDCDGEGNNILEAGRGIVEGGAKRAKLSVNNWNESAPFLTEQADYMFSLINKNKHINSYFIDIFDRADEFIRSAASKIATNAADGNNFDGPAITSGSSEPDRWGLLGLASIIEARVRGLYQAEGGVPVNIVINVNYVTTLTFDNRDFAPFGINGNAVIRRSPRVVYLTLEDREITARDLWHIAYTLYHELVCHIFQGARSSARLEDAHPTCHWSEGWMDTIAFDLVADWDDAPRAWLPLRGENARGEIRRFHEERYVNPPLLKGNDRKRRQRARDAYRKLAEVLYCYRLCVSKAEAQGVVRRFSLLANAHPEADWKRLKTLATRLIGLLLTSARAAAPISAARACLAFTESHDLAKLEQEIEAQSR